MNIIATTGTTKLVAIKEVKKLLIGLKAFAPQISVLMPNGIAPLSSKIGNSAKTKVASIALSLNILIINSFIVSAMLTTLFVKKHNFNFFNVLLDFKK